MKIPNGAPQLADGIWEVGMAEIETDHHKGWDSLDEYVESVAMSMRPEHEFESDGMTFMLFLNGHQMITGLEMPSAEDRYRLSSCAAVIYRGTREKPIYFINYDEGVGTWNKLCADKGHLEAKFKDAPPATGNKYLN